jgi:hypothetical protein
MTIPALAPAVSATEEVNDTVAVVDVAATLDARATERSFIHEIAGNVPDVDLQTLVDGFKSGAIINTAKVALTQAVATSTGGAALITALGTLQTTASTFNTTVTGKINKLAIKRAVESYINYVVFNLLTGCSNTLLNATLRPEVKEVLTPYATYVQKQQLDAALDGATGQPFTNTTLAT